MKSTSLACFALLALAASLAGCGNKQEAPSSAGASAAPAQNAPPAAASGTAAAAAPGGERPVLGSCNDKSSGMCKEYLGVLPLLAEDLCKGLEGKGVLTKGSTPCSRDKLVGTCEIKGDEASELWYYYAQAGITADMNKMGCEIVGKWTPASKAAAAASGAASAPASTGAAKPAGAPAKPAPAPKKRK